MITDAVITVTRDDGPRGTGTADWHVSVALDGMERNVALCPYQQYADVVALALSQLTDDQLRYLGTNVPITRPGAQEPR